MVVFDTAVLLLVMDPRARSEVAQAARRVEHLIGTLTTDMEKIVIPTPVLSEILVHAGAAMQGYLDTLNRAVVTAEREQGDFQQDRSRAVAATANDVFPVVVQSDKAVQEHDGTALAGFDHDGGHGFTREPDERDLSRVFGRGWVSR